jgi:nitroreductase
MIEIINSRRSVRKFKKDPVAQKNIDEILEAAMNAPSAINTQPWHFIVLTGDILAQYFQINSNVPASAPMGILVCGDKDAIPDADYYIQDCSAASQNILLACHAKGLGAVWTTIFPDAAAAVRNLLRLPANIVPVSFIPIGYPVSVPAAKSRYDKLKVHYNSWQ